MFRTPGYWALRTVTPATLGNNRTDTISRELEAAGHKLDVAISDVRSERTRWNGSDHEPIALVLDTGAIEAHATELFGVDWHGLADVRPNRYVILVVTRVVLDEIDRHKLSRDNRREARVRQSKAHSAIKALWSIFGSMQQFPNFAQKGGAVDRIGRFGLLNDSLDHIQLNDPDAELLARSCTLRPYIPVKVLTFDTGMALRGIVAGIDVARLQQHQDDD